MFVRVLLQQCRCSRSLAEDVTITDVIIKTPDGKCDWGVDDVMPGSDRLGILVTFGKAVSWDSTLGEGSWDLSMGEASCDMYLGEASWDSDLGEASPVVAYGTRRAFVGSDGTVSLVKIVSVSPRVKKLKVKKVKRFVPELKKVVSISVFPCLWTFYIFVFRICFMVL